MASARPANTASKTTSEVGVDVDVGVGGIPASNEKFVLKDLDTGMQSYVTDQEWVEKPVVPAPAPAPAPPSRKPPPIPITNNSNESIAKSAGRVTRAKFTEPLSNASLSTEPPRKTIETSSSSSVQTQPALSRRPPTHPRLYDQHDLKYNFNNVKPPTKSNLNELYFPQVQLEQTNSTNSGNSSNSNFHDIYHYHSDHSFLRTVDHVRVLAHKKRDREFGNMHRWQKVHAHHGCIHVMEFSSSGEWLATAGADTFVKIWHIDANLEDESPSCKTSDMVNNSEPSTPLASTSSSSKHSDTPRSSVDTEKKGRSRNNGRLDSGTGAYCTHMYIRHGSPFLTCRGHTSAVIDLAWSKNDFLVSASLDGTVRLWHPRSRTCLRRLIHTDRLTSVAFHPTDEQICISGSANGSIFMWHLKHGECLSEVDTDDIVTALAVTPDGTTGLVGTLHGRCKFYALFDEIQGEWQFKHTTQLDVRSKRSRNAPGKKICGFHFYGRQADKVLISSNDSRLRLYRLDDKSVVCKFVGHANYEERLSGSFDPSGRFVLCGSEDRKVLIWDLQHGKSSEEFYDEFSDKSKIVADQSDEEDEELDEDKLSESHSQSQHHEHNHEQPPLHASPPSQQQLQQRKDVGAVHESFLVQDSGHVTAAAFAPRIIPRDSLSVRRAFSSSSTSGLIIVTASNDGFLRVFGSC